MPRIDAEYLARELSRGVSFPEIAEVTGVSSGALRACASRNGLERAEVKRSNTLLSVLARLDAEDLISARDRAMLRAAEECTPIPDHPHVFRGVPSRLEAVSKDLKKWARWPGSWPSGWREVQEWRAQRDLMLRRNNGLLVYLGRKWAAHTSDEWTAAVEGFLTAIDLLDPRGATLATYAYPWVGQAVQGVRARSASEGLTAGRPEANLGA